jgi:hypothetical protein
LQKAYTLLGISSSAAPSEIDEAYRAKKELYNPDRYLQNSAAWRFACARSEALDGAYRLVSGKAGRAGGSSGEMAGILIFCPVMAFCMQSMAPTILSDLAPANLLGAVRLAGAAVFLLGCVFPLFLRFAFLRRPLGNFGERLALFPVTLLSADLASSAFFSFSSFSSAYGFASNGFTYVPASYLMSWGPLFLLLYAHCAILAYGRGKTSAAFRRGVPFLKRLAVQTLVLALSGALSVSLAASFGRGAGEEDASLAHEPADPFGESGAWRALELRNAGSLEMPGSWQTEDGRSGLSEVRHGSVIQYICRALTAYPYGNRETGADFLFEVVVYWWTRLDGRPLPLPKRVVGRLQEQQLDSLQRRFADISSFERTETYGGRPVDALTMETLSVSDYPVRFKNLAFEQGGRLYAVMVGYPAHEEPAWESVLDRIMDGWDLPGD